MIKNIFILHAIFYFPMWISKTLHLIYWENTGNIELFSVSYVSMVLVGTFAFIYTGVIRICGLPLSLAIGLFSYSLGLILRAFPINIEVALASGITAGIGASIIGLSLKGLIIEVDITERDKVILHSDNIFTISQSIGAVLSGVLVSLVGIFSTNGYQISLLITGLLTMSGFLFIPWRAMLSFDRLSTSSSSPLNITTLDFIIKNKSLFFCAFTSMFILGLSWGVILPLIPIFMKKIGFSINKIGFIISLGVISGFVLKNIYIYFYFFRNKNKKTSALLFSMLTAIIIYFSFLFFGMNWTLAYAIMMVLFYTFRTVNSFLIDIIEMSIVGKQYLMIFFGVRQTAFLLGDMIGGGIMPVLYKKNILTHYPSILSLFIFLGTALLMLCKQSEDPRETYAS